MACAASASTQVGDLAAEPDPLAFYSGVSCLQAFSERFGLGQVAGSNVAVEFRRGDLKLLGVNGVERCFELFDVAFDFIESGVAHTALAAGSFAVDVVASST